MDVVVVVVVEVGVGVGVGGGGEESGAEEVEGRDAGGEVGEGQPEHERPGAGMGHRQRVFEEGERHDGARSSSNTRFRLLSPQRNGLNPERIYICYTFIYI